MLNRRRTGITLLIFLLLSALAFTGNALGQLPLCTTGTCGPANGCPSSAPYCVQSQIPCDKLGRYAPGENLEMFCCEIKIDNYLSWCRGDKTNELFKAFCQCACEHRNTDPYLRTHSSEFICSD